MMKEKQIRTWIPFIMVFLSSFFLSDADMLHNFGNRYDFVDHNVKLIWMFIIGDVGQMIEASLCSLIFFTAWKKNKDNNKWYSELHWQLAGLFFCWAISCALSFVSNFASFLWIQGLARLMVFLFWLYFLNNLYRARNMLYYPETRDETIKKAQAFNELKDKFDELLKTNSK